MSMFQIYVALIGVAVIIAVLVIMKVRERGKERRQAAKQEFLDTLNESDMATVKEALCKIGILEKHDDLGCGYYFEGSRAFKLYGPSELAPVIGSLINDGSLYIGTIVSSVLNLNPDQETINSFVAEARHRHWDVGDQLILEFEAQTKQREENQKSFEKAQAISRGIAILKKM